jgi:APA family basic amino acid/polyamine antiporter
VAAAALPSLLMLWRYTASSGLTVFTYLVDLTVAIPYLFSACAQLTYLVSRRRPVQGWLLASAASRPRHPSSPCGRARHTGRRLR